MYKKIAFLLILILMCNMTLWGDELKNNDIIGGIVIGVVVWSVFWGLIWLFIGWDRVDITDSYDNEKKFVSMDNEELINDPGLNKLMNVFQYIEIGVTQNNDVYLGVCFKY